MAIQHPIPVDVLRKLIRLDHETGRLFWLPRGPEWFADCARGAQAQSALWNGQFAGKEAINASNGNGYRKGQIFGRKYYAHRVIFALFYGRWPTELLDHINGDRADNRLSNLREASHSQNHCNAVVRAGSSRFRGVSWAANVQKWHAYHRDADGRRINIGWFDDEAEAARAYDRAAREHYGEFARLNFPD